MGGSGANNTIKKIERKDGFIVVTDLSNVFADGKLFKNCLTDDSILEETRSTEEELPTLTVACTRSGKTVHGKGRGSNKAAYERAAYYAVGVSAINAKLLDVTWASSSPKQWLAAHDLISPTRSQ